MSESDASRINRRLRAARERLDWSREALAFHTGLSWSAIAQIESGRRSNVRPATLAALSDALGVSIDYLLGRDDSGRSMLEHCAMVYATHDEFLESASEFIAEGIKRSEATLAVTTASKIRLLRKEIGGKAADVTFVEARRWYTTPSAALVGYREFVEQNLQSGSGWIRILGEPVWSGRTTSEVARWTRYESLLNLEFARTPVTIACPYDSSALDPAILEQAHATHQHTRTHGETARNPNYVEPSHFALEP
jgi:transcriptional regulator with XRE-family HTH domain